MRKRDNNTEAFYALLRAGLWEKDVEPLPLGQLDFQAIYQLAEEQSSVGLIAAGLERVKDMKVPQAVVLQFVGSTLQTEQRNKAMNQFVAVLTRFLNKEGIYSLLVKGQGVAQCYERPLWRASGDVDLLLDAENYEKAKKVLTPLAVDVRTEYTYFKHLAMTIEGWEVELHGTRQSRLSRRIDDQLEVIQKGCFDFGDVRVWRDGETDIHLPGVDADVPFIFTHILHHFFFEGVGVRQICDWCRLLWTYRDSLDVELLETRLRKMGLMSEWKAFAAFAVDYLGMPVEAMPLFDDNDNANENLKRKARRIGDFVMKVGNFGHNMVRISRLNKPYLIRKLISLWEHLNYVLRQFMIFPLDSIRFVWEVARSGLHGVVKGE